MKLKINRKTLIGKYRADKTRFNFGSFTKRHAFFIALLVVFVSDEDDQSMHDMISLDDFIDWYAAQRQTVFLSSIVNLEPADSSCNATSHNVGERYIDATNYFSGIIVDICSDDWPIIVL